MSTLTEQHPLQRVIGMAKIIGQRLRLKGLMPFAYLAGLVETWGREARAVDEEIVADAALLEDRFAAALEDGVVDATERADLIDLIAEIGTQAREGRVIPTKGAA